MIFNKLEFNTSYAEILNKLNSNKTYSTKFKTIFKKIYQEPYYQYFKTQKLIQAKNLIEKEEYSVKEVSELLGYSEPIKFILVFKKRYQITPGKLKTKYHSEFSAAKKQQL